MLRIDAFAVTKIKCFPIHVAVSDTLFDTHDTEAFCYMVSTSKIVEEDAVVLDLLKKAFLSHTTFPMS